MSATARRGFDHDLLDGQAGEESFARILLGGRELFEHKKDHWFKRTGNIAVELETSTLPYGEGSRYASGIKTCEAYWWIVEYLPERRLIIPTEELRELALRAVYEGRGKWIGDDNRFHNALVPGEWLLEAS